MSNTEKKLDALIDALGFDVDRVNVNPRKNDRYPSEAIWKYTLADRKPAMVPLPVDSEAWGCIVHYVMNHAGDIEAGTNDFDTLRPIMDFIYRGGA